MNRRELLKPLAALVAAPVLVKGQAVGQSIAIDPEKKYVVFINPDQIDIEALAKGSNFPPGTWIHAIFPDRDGNIDQAIRIYELK